MGETVPEGRAGDWVGVPRDPVGDQEAEESGEGRWHSRGSEDGGENHSNEEVNMMASCWSISSVETWEEGAVRVLV